MTSKRHTLLPLPLLAALGLLSLLPGTAAAVDTSAWKCESCPFEKAGISGTVEGGLVGVSDDSARFGEYNGLHQRGVQLWGNAQARWRAADGYYGSLDAASDTATLRTEVGLEGRVTLRLGWSEIDRHVSDTTQTPFLGSGGTVQTLPAGYPAGTTQAMPLATTLHEQTLGTRRTRWDAGLRWTPGERWTLRLDARHETRHGTQRLAASFFSTATELAAPVDQSHDQFELSASYAGRAWQATLGYQVAVFRNQADSLTWSNPFTPVVAGATRGQMALAPDNQFHQALGSAGWQILPSVRVSGDVAIGRMSQDQGFVAPTLNGSLASPTVLALPARSLDGRVDTFVGNVRLHASPSPLWQVNAAYGRDVRDNRTASLLWPAVTTDLFVGATPRRNLPYDVKRDKYTLDTTWRAAVGGLSASAGIEQDDRERNYQERVFTRETTLWGRAGAQWKNGVSVSVKLSHAERTGTTYGVATYVDPAENPLLRKYTLADRNRDAVALRADWTVSETLSVGFNAQGSHDSYGHTVLGLTDGHSGSVGGDVSYALSDETQLRAYLQSDRIRSSQAGSQAYAAPDWTAHHDDRSQLLGIGVKHSALKGKLELAADYTVTRSRSDLVVDARAAEPAFPSATTGLDTFKLQATWTLSKSLAVVGALWHEEWRTADWQRDGVLPSTVYNLLTLGDTSPDYRVNVVKLGLRWQF